MHSRCWSNTFLSFIRFVSFRSFARIRRNWLHAEAPREGKMKSIFLHNDGDASERAHSFVRLCHWIETGSVVMVRAVAMLLTNDEDDDDGVYPVAECSKQPFEFLFAKNSNFKFILKFNFNVEFALYVLEQQLGVGWNGIGSKVGFGCWCCCQCHFCTAVWAMSCIGIVSLHKFEIARCCCSSILCATKFAWLSYNVHKLFRHRLRRRCRLYHR